MLPDAPGSLPLRSHCQHLTVSTALSCPFYAALIVHIFIFSCCYELSTTEVVVKVPLGACAKKSLADQ